MTIRLRIIMRMHDNEVTACALANTGFEGLGPDVMIPMDVAQALNLRPSPGDFECIRSTYCLRNHTNI